MRFSERHPALKPTVIAAVIGSIFLSGAAYAQEEQESFWDSVGFTYGGGFEYEVKKTADYFPKNTTDKSIALQLGKVSASFASFNGLATYSLKKVRYLQNNDQNDDKYTSDGLKHEFLFGRSFAIGSGGFTGGFYYNATLEETKKDTNKKLGLSQRAVDQRLRPTISYWNNNGNWGVYGQYEQIQIDTNNEVDWNTDRYKLAQRGNTWLIEPYMKFGNWRLGVEFYRQRLRQKTDVGASRTQEDTYTESYYEPKVTYSFENAGVLSVRARFGEKETYLTGGAWATPGTRYFSDLRKLTVGYEQNVGNWQFSAQYRKSSETEKSNASWAEGRKKKIDQDKYEAFATYRF